MLTTKLTNIANAIRNKTKTSVTMTLDEMPSKIESIETASKPNLQDKEVTPTKETQVVNYDEEYDGLNQVTVKPIPNEYIIPDGTLEVAQNGDVDVTNFKKARVGVYTPPNLQDKTVEITENGTQTITADSGYDGLNEVEVITNVASSGGGTTSGVTMYNLNADGYPLIVEAKGMSVIPNYYFAPQQSGATGVTSKMTTCIIGASVTTINLYAFSNCKALKTVQFETGSKLTSIKNYAFNNCTSLETVNFKEGITSFGTDVFVGCTSLKIKTLPDSLKTMEYRCFKNTTSLVQLSMNGVTRINAGNTSNATFEGSGIKAVWMGSAINNNGFGSHVFYKATNLIRIFVNLPRATVETFSYYSTKWSANTVHADCQIICNDDEGFMTKEQFDAIDWGTYTE